MLFKLYRKPAIIFNYILLIPSKNPPVRFIQSVGPIYTNAGTSHSSKFIKLILFVRDCLKLKNHPPKSPSRGIQGMELALFVFMGSLDIKVELNRLRTTVKKMLHDST